MKLNENIKQNQLKFYYFENEMELKHYGYLIFLIAISGYTKVKGQTNIALKRAVIVGGGRLNAIFDTRDFEPAIMITKTKYVWLKIVFKSPGIITKLHLDTFILGGNVSLLLLENKHEEPDPKKHFTCFNIINPSRFKLFPSLISCSSPKAHSAAAFWTLSMEDGIEHKIYGIRFEGADPLMPVLLGRGNTGAMVDGMTLVGVMLQGGPTPLWLKIIFEGTHANMNISANATTSFTLATGEGKTHVLVLTQKDDYPSPDEHHSCFNMEVHLVTGDIPYPDLSCSDTDNIVAVALWGSSGVNFNVYEVIVSCAPGASTTVLLGGKVLVLLFSALRNKFPLNIE